MSPTLRVIAIEPLAPCKPAWAAPCNGCGLCCLFEPCPLGMLLSRRRQGACVALHWQAPHQRYRCGALAQPAVVLARVLPRPLRGLGDRLAPVLGRWAARWIAAGTGCDSHLSASRPTP